MFSHSAVTSNCTTRWNSEFWNPLRCCLRFNPLHREDWLTSIYWISWLCTAALCLFGDIRITDCQAMPFERITNFDFLFYFFYFFYIETNVFLLKLIFEITIHTHSSSTSTMFEVFYKDVSICANWINTHPEDLKLCRVSTCCLIQNHVKLVRFLLKQENYAICFFTSQLCTILCWPRT